ncbi:MAG TPA: DUF116 domain-containing protein [Candidatus Tripitaka californicus]|uniref:DUF116 domain-containing protein n=2 Tax=Candidatus Tripitaka californicus TaxID=3367616 RepID=UPI00402930E6
MTLSETIDSKFVSLSNLVNKLRAAKCPPNSLLILFPHCIQYSKCPQKITLDLGECKRCGKCKVKNLLELSEKYGVQIAVASGGRVALQRVKSEEIRGVVAVACEKELRIGLMAAMPKAIMAVPNLRPHGYCKDTDVTMEEVEKEILRFLEVQAKK